MNYYVKRERKVVDGIPITVMRKVYLDQSLTQETEDSTQGVISHSDLSGLDRNDHPQYALSAETRAQISALQLATEQLFNDLRTSIQAGELDIENLSLVSRLDTETLVTASTTYSLANIELTRDPPRPDNVLVYDATNQLLVWRSVSDLVDQSATGVGETTVIEDTTDLTALESQVSQNVLDIATLRDDIADIELVADYAVLNTDVDFASVTTVGNIYAGGTVGGSNFAVDQQLTNASYSTIYFQRLGGIDLFSHYVRLNKATSVFEISDNTVVEGSLSANTLYCGSTNLTDLFSGTGGGVTDHGALTGLGDNDHPQYALTATNVEFQAITATSDIYLTNTSTSVIFPTGLFPPTYALLKFDSDITEPVAVPPADNLQGRPLSFDYASDGFVIQNNIAAVDVSGVTFYSGGVDLATLIAGAGVTDHGALTGLDDNDHPQYALSANLETVSASLETHTADTSIHFTEASIDHGSISGLLDDDHPQYAFSADLETVSASLETHTADTSIHFTEASIDHGSIAGLTDNDHPQYALTGSSVEFNSVSATGQIFSGGTDLATLINSASITDHGALTGLGDNDHPQYALTGQNAVFDNITATSLTTTGTSIHTTTIDASDGITGDTIWSVGQITVDTGTSNQSTIRFRRSNGTFALLSFDKPEDRFSLAFGLDVAGAVEAGTSFSAANSIVVDSAQNGDRGVYWFDGAPGSPSIEYSIADSRFVLNKETRVQGPLSTNDVLCADTQIYCGGTSLQTLLDNVESSSGTQAGSNVEFADLTASTLYSNGNVYVNYDGPDADSHIWFYDGGSSTGRYLKWDDSSSRFRFNAPLEVDGNLVGTNFYAQSNSFVAGNLYLNYDGPDGDSFIYFYEGGSNTGRHLKWDDSSNRFEFNDTLYLAAGTLDRPLYLASTSRRAGITFEDDTASTQLDWDGTLNTFDIYGDIHVGRTATDASVKFASGGGSLTWDDASSRFEFSDYTYFASLIETPSNVVAGELYSRDNLYLGYNDSDADRFIYFREGGSNTGRYLKWDDADSRFELNDDLVVDGNSTLSGQVNVYNGNDAYPLQIQRTGGSAAGIQYSGDGGIMSMYGATSSDEWAFFNTSSDVQVVFDNNGIRSYKNNIYLNYDGPDSDSSIYFYDGGSSTGQRIYWDDSGSRFIVTSDWITTGDLQANGDVYVNRDVDGDGFLYFREGGSATGRHLKWDDSSNRFEFNDQLYSVQLETNRIIIDQDSTSGWMVIDPSGSDGLGISLRHETIPGGWARGYNFSTGASSSDITGGFGALGSSSAITYLHIGRQYNDTTIRIDPDTYQVGIGANQGVVTGYDLAVDGDALFESNVNTFGTFQIDGTIVLDYASSTVAVGREQAAGGSNNVFIGTNALDSNTNNEQVAVGALAGDGTNATAFVRATLMGYAAANGAAGTLSDMTAIGWRAARESIDADGGTYVGSYAGYFQTGDSVVSVGYLASYQAANENSTSVGMEASRGSSSRFTVDIGWRAGRDGSSDNNVNIGYLAATDSPGGGNVAIGQYAHGDCSTSNSESVYVGKFAGYQSVNTDDIVAVGRSAGVQSTGNSNVFIGRSAGSQADADRTIAIGYEAADDAVGNNNIFLGYQMGSGSTNSGELVIGHALLNSTPIISGDLSTNELWLDGQVTINRGTTVDATALELLSNNQDLTFRMGNDPADAAGYGFKWTYNGTGSGNLNSLSYIAENQSGPDIEVFETLQDGTTDWKVAPTINGQAILTGTTSSGANLGEFTFVDGEMYVNSGGTDDQTLGIFFRYGTGGKTSPNKAGTISYDPTGAGSLSILAESGNIRIGTGTGPTATNSVEIGTDVFRYDRGVNGDHLITFRTGTSVTATFGFDDSESAFAATLPIEAPNFTIDGTDVAKTTDVQVFNSDGTWNKPADAKWIEVHMWGGGGGGGAGGRAGSTFGTAWGGGGGGAGGYYRFLKYDANDLGSSESVVVGSGGTGGAGTSTQASKGADGDPGGTSQFGSQTVIGGAGGTGGSAGAASAGDYRIDENRWWKLGNGWGLGASGGTGADGGGGGSSNATQGERTFEGGGGGGGGGAYDTRPTGAQGGSEYNDFEWTGGETGAGSTTDPINVGGTGGQGGSGNGLDSDGDAGFNGAVPAGGGGGGAGALGLLQPSTQSGSGGNGGKGRVIVITYF